MQYFNKMYVEDDVYENQCIYLNNCFYFYCVYLLILRKNHN